MTYENLAYMHLATVAPAAVIGTYLMIVRKGSAIHKWLGKVYMLLMLITAVISLLMPAKIGFNIFGHFGPIHLLSILAIVSVIAAYDAIKRKNIDRHRKAMISLFTGGVVIAGTFTLMPGRFLHSLLFS